MIVPSPTEIAAPVERISDRLSRRPAGPPYHRPRGEMASVSDLERELHKEGSAGAETAVHADGASQLLDDPAHDEETEAQSVALTDHRPALEGFEDGLPKIGLDPQPLVGHRQPAQAALRVGAGPNHHRAPLPVLD